MEKVIKDNKFFIYALCDPDNELPYYVGKTLNIEKRYKAHLGLHYGKSLKKSWIVKLKKLNKLPELLILESNIDKELVNAREIYWIEYCKHINNRLKNMTAGGDGGTTHQGRPVALKCINNGKIYATSREAGKCLKICYKQISQQLTGKQKSVHGYIFKFIRKAE